MSLPAGEERAPESGVAPAPAPAGSARRGPHLRPTLAVLVVVGAELGLLGGFLTPSAPRLLGVAVPLGPVLALVGNLAVGLWVVRATGSQGAVAAPAAAWLVVALALGVQRAEGDLVLPGSAVGGAKSYAFLLFGSLAWAIAAITGRPAAANVDHGTGSET